MAIAAHPLQFLVSATDGSYVEMDGINDISFGPSADLLETTDFKDTTGTKSRIAGLKDGTIQFSGDYESADAPQASVLTQMTAGSALWCKILWNGSTGHKVQGIVESVEIKGSFDGKVEFSATVQFNGAFAAV